MGEPIVVVIMGVAGAGKTTIGRRLAQQLHWTFLDADDFHPAENILKMTRGEPLDDTDRAPWISAMQRALAEQVRQGNSVVLAASMLKDSYRAQLAAGPPTVQYVYLLASPELIARRLARRSDHFMKAEMLASQFDALEEPAGALIVDADQLPDDIVAAVIDGLPQE